MPSKLWVTGSNPVGVAKMLKYNIFYLSNNIFTESAESCWSMVNSRHISERSDKSNTSGARATVNSEKAEQMALIS
jgi:hypothetical protein